MFAEPVCVAPTGDKTGEGIVWHEGHSALYWVDINRFLIHRFTLTDQCVRTWFFDEPVTAIARTDRESALVVVLGSRVILWEPSSDSRKDQGFRLDGWPSVRFNDARADPRGFLWAGSMSNNVHADGSEGECIGQHGMLYRIGTDVPPEVFRREIGCSNTVAWSPEKDRFYFGDSLANVVWVYDYALSTATISNERPFLQGYTRGLPDGSAVDSEGYLWNCRYGGGCIVRVAPDGVIDQVIEMPVRNVTTCTFGGTDLKTLYVTTASEMQPFNRLAGGLFAIRTEVSGQPENLFRAFQ